MRPGTKFNWIDESGISKEIANIPVMPLYLTAISADRGPEEMVNVFGENFYKLYGSDISFERHGQPLVQAANIIDNGGQLIVKRVVADDATLANLAIVAKVKETQTQKTNTAGIPLYADAITGEETTDSTGNTPIMINKAEITYDTYSTDNVKTIEEIEEEVIKYLDDAGTGGEYVYPLYIVAENGRGKSSKRIRITPDYNVSKNIGFQMYKLENVSNIDIEKEHIRFSVNPDIIYLNKSLSLSMTGKDMLQLKAKTFENSSELFINRISEITGVEVDDLKKVDILFGRTLKGEKLSYISIDTVNGYDLNESLGLNLLEGTNGSFGDSPFGTTDYTNQLVNFYNGTFDDSIFDVDKYKIEACFDANYPSQVKKAIEELVLFREDFMFMEDIGLDNNSYDTIVVGISDRAKTKFCAIYPQSFDVVDPFTKKQISVTMTYLMSLRMINHLNASRNAPACGIIHGFTFPEIIEGSISFVPKITPKVDQKTELEDLNVNYASYLNGVLTMETSATSQDPYTQLSFIGNVLSVQEVARAVRTACPKFRYSFITSDDLDTYKNDVQAVLNQFSSNFEELEFAYVSDDLMSANKIFTASFKFRFRNYIQSEIFDLYALA